jgi:hypothetical protein
VPGGDAAVKRWAVRVAAVLVVAVAVGAATALHLRREREWAHGGDDVAVEVHAVVATEETFDDVAVRLGVPPGEAVRYSGAAQSIVVRVRWTGMVPTGGWFQMMVLDKRFDPGQLLAVDGSWGSEGGGGGNWASSYEILASRYAWLSGVARELYVDPPRMYRQPTAAVSAAATGSGTVTGWYRQWRDGALPIDDPATDTLVALVLVDEDGEVRWARRVYG